MIPRVAHFVWLGNGFPWVNVLALVSAAKSGGFERIVLHLDGSKESVMAHHELAQMTELEVRPVDIRRLAAAAGLDPEMAVTQFEHMTSAAARSDVIRALVLLGEGGVYLDMDTITVQSFHQLLADAGAFVGQERICFPGWHHEPPRLAQRTKGYGLSALRWILATVPGGFRTFSRLESHYSLWANNAVMGCEPGHPFMLAYATTMLRLDPDVARRRYGVGPDLLERVLDEYSSTERPVIRVDPSTFYPLPPVISGHWWKRTKNPNPKDVLAKGTLVVHWYASVRNRKRTGKIDANWVKGYENHCLFAKLASRYIERH